MKKITGTYNYEQARGLKYFLGSNEDLVVGIYNEEPTIFIGVTDKSMLPLEYKDMDIFDKPKCSCFNVCSFIEPDEKFNILIEKLEYIRLAHGQETFNKMILLPANAIDTSAVKKYKFNMPVDNGIRDFSIFYVEQKVRKYRP